MKRLSILLFSCLFCIGIIAQSRESVSILGDSYSTFEGYMTPSTNELWYYAKPGERTDVTDVSETWWHKFIKENGYKLCVNNSYSGATIGYYGYNGNDYTDRSFITRMNNLGCPDIIFIFGGTNDSWAKAPIGEYQYDNFRNDDFFTYRPALAYLLKSMKDRYVNVDIYFIINSGLSEEITASTIEICNHYGIKYIRLHDIDKKNGHPSIKGHAMIAEQIKERFR
ncbi:MAG: SGNH/GDSL hydrolase family protein [Prevotellaceae bacterium]|nr:SGNH/GDSL hydrolase family protein [Prevotellaceae bacterium]